MKLLETLVAAVPQGKALVWMLAGFAMSFGAGAGAVLGFGETADSIALVPAMKITVDDNVRRLNAIDVSLVAGANARDRILCIVSLNATAGTIVPSLLDEECPP